jgi:flagellar hook protein FlgE|tara:strand:+ start:613 stop:1089 length:477 start_codon:yes stop_codon:yes gene_type:complete
MVSNARQIASFPPPTFRACKVSSNQTFSDATYTKITFDQEDWDIGGYYASNTYTPLVQGYYQVNVSLHLSSAVDTQGGLVALYHNGSMTRFNRLYLAGLTNDDFYISTFKFNGMVYMDGVDDYIEVYFLAYSEDSGNCIIGADTRATYFEAFLVSRSG